MNFADAARDSASIYASEYCFRAYFADRIRNVAESRQHFNLPDIRVSAIYEFLEIPMTAGDTGMPEVSKKQVCDNPDDILACQQGRVSSIY